MKAFRRMAAVFTILVLCSAATQGQVMSQVPASALVVLHVKNPADLSQKVGGMMGQLGLPPVPPFNDLFGSLTSQIKASQGINKTTDMAVVVVNDGKGMNGPTPPILTLIGTDDYKAFLANYPGATTDGAVSTIKMPDGQTVYTANWGSYIALSPTKDFVALAPGGVTLTAAAQKEVDAHDITVVVNMPALRELVNPLLAVGRTQFLTMVAQGIRQSPYAKYAGVFRVGFSEGIDFLSALLNQCDDITIGLSMGDGGIGTTVMADFKPDSHYGQLIAQEKNTDQPLLAGLPEGKYLGFGGEISNPKVDNQLLSELLDPITAELAKLGPDGQTAVDYVQAIEALDAAQTGTTYAMIAPEGEMQTSPLLQFVAIRNGDAKALSVASTKMIQTQIAQSKTATGAAMPVQMTYTAAGKTVEGVTLDQFHVGMDMTKATTPELQKIGMIINMAYGADGLNMYGGVLNDGTYIQMAGMSDDKMVAAIDAAKAGDAPLAKRAGVINTAGKLPTQRMAVTYIPLDTVVNTVFGYMAKLGLDMGVTMPECDPIGVTVGTDGSAARFDSYIPTQILTNAAKVGTKLLAPHVAPGGAPAGAPAGGGL